MHREQAQHEHDKYMPVCHGRVEQAEADVWVLLAAKTGPWFCPDCDWQEGKKAASLLPDLGTELPKVDTH